MTHENQDRWSVHADPRHSHMSSESGWSPLQSVVVASRPSKLAMTQTQLAIDAVRRAISALQQDLASQDQGCPSFVLRSFKTLKVPSLGDQQPSASLDVLAAMRSLPGPGGVFTTEVEEKVILGEASVAVHSLKDLPSHVMVNDHLAVFVYPALLERADPRDVIVLRSDVAKFVTQKMKDCESRDSVFQCLPLGSVIGTSAVRRRAFIREKYPHLLVRDIRGNVDSRLGQLESASVNGHQYDGLILAAAGLQRLNIEHLIFSYLDPIIYPYSPGQGALVCQCLKSDSAIISLFKVADHLPTRLEVLSERHFLSSINGSCQLPIGVACQCRIICEDEKETSENAPSWDESKSRNQRVQFTDNDHGPEPRCCVFEMFLFGRIWSPDGCRKCNAFNRQCCNISYLISHKLTQQKIRKHFSIDLAQFNLQGESTDKVSPPSKSPFSSLIFCNTFDDLFTFVKGIGEKVATLILNDEEGLEIRTQLIKTVN